MDPDTGDPQSYQDPLHGSLSLVQVWSRFLNHTDINAISAAAHRPLTSGWYRDNLTLDWGWYGYGGGDGVRRILDSGRGELVCEGWEELGPDGQCIPATSGRSVIDIVK